MLRKNSCSKKVTAVKKKYEEVASPKVKLSLKSRYMRQNGNCHLKKLTKLN